MRHSHAFISIIVFLICWLPSANSALETPTCPVNLPSHSKQSPIPLPFDLQDDPDEPNIELIYLEEAVTNESVVTLTLRNLPTFVPVPDKPVPFGFTIEMYGGDAQSCPAPTPIIGSRLSSTSFKQALMADHQITSTLISFKLDMMLNQHSFSTCYAVSQNDKKETSTQIAALLSPSVVNSSTDPALRCSFTLYFVQVFEQGSDLVCVAQISSNTKSALGLTSVIAKQLDDFNGKAIHDTSLHPLEKDIYDYDPVELSVNYVVGTEPTTPHTPRLDLVELTLTALPPNRMFELQIGFDHRTQSRLDRTFFFSPELLHELAEFWAHLEFDVLPSVLCGQDVRLAVYADEYAEAASILVVTGANPTPSAVCNIPIPLYLIHHHYTRVNYLDIGNWNGKNLSIFVTLGDRIFRFDTTDPRAVWNFYDPLLVPFNSIIGNAQADALHTIVYFRYNFIIAGPTPEIIPGTHFEGQEGFLKEVFASSQVTLFEYITNPTDTFVPSHRYKLDPEALLSDQPLPISHYNGFLNITLHFEVYTSRLQLFYLNFIIDNSPHYISFLPQPRAFFEFSAGTDTSLVTTVKFLQSSNDKFISIPIVTDNRDWYDFVIPPLTPALPLDISFNFRFQPFDVVLPLTTSRPACVLVYHNAEGEEEVLPSHPRFDVVQNSLLASFHTDYANAVEITNVAFPVGYYLRLTCTHKIVDSTHKPRLCLNQAIDLVSCLTLNTLQSPIFSRIRGVFWMENVDPRASAANVNESTRDDALAPPTTASTPPTITTTLNTTHPAKPQPHPAAQNLQNTLDDPTLHNTSNPNSNDWSHTSTAVHAAFLAEGPSVRDETALLSLLKTLTEIFATSAYYENTGFDQIPTSTPFPKSFYQMEAWLHEGNIPKTLPLNGFSNSGHSSQNPYLLAQYVSETDSSAQADPSSTFHKDRGKLSWLSLSSNADTLFLSVRLKIDSTAADPTQDPAVITTLAQLSRHHFKPMNGVTLTFLPSWSTIITLTTPSLYSTRALLFPNDSHHVDRLTATDDHVQYAEVPLMTEARCLTSGNCQPRYTCIKERCVGICILNLPCNTEHLSLNLFSLQESYLHHAYLFNRSAILSDFVLPPYHPKEVAKHGLLWYIGIGIGILALVLAVIFVIRWFILRRKARSHQESKEDGFESDDDGDDNEFHHSHYNAPQTHAINANDDDSEYEDEDDDDEDDDDE